MDSPDQIIITDEEAGERLDKILANRYQEVQSRSYFQRLISDHLVLLNGEPVKKRTKPQAGDEVEVEFALTPEIELTPEAIPLDILYEDADVIAVNKAPGMVVHPAPGNWSGTFVNALLHHCNMIAEEDSLRPGIVHRLDKDTSGVLVAAKNSRAQQKLTEMFASRAVEKTYVAVCIGNPGEGEVNAAIGRHPVHRKQMQVRDDGREALTLYKTLAFRENLSVVEVDLKTGRTHQIRVHMKHRGMPVLGDAVYGNAGLNKKYHAERQLLHAAVLRFDHPITGKPLEIKAPIPDDMRAFVDKIGGEACGL